MPSAGKAEKVIPNTSGRQFAQTPAGRTAMRIGMRRARKLRPLECALPVLMQALAEFLTAGNEKGPGSCETGPFLQSCNAASGGN
jgi:hypothetical protein